MSSSLVGLAVTFATIPFYLNAIGAPRFGAMSLVWLFLGYFSLFDLGLSRATANLLAKLHDASDERREEVFWTAIFTNLMIGSAGGVLLCLVLGQAADTLLGGHPELVIELRAGLPFLALGVPIVTVTGVLVGALDARDKFLQANATQTFSAILFQVAPLIASIVFGPQLPLLISAAVAMRLLGIIPLAYFSSKYIPVTRIRKVNFRILKQLFSFGGWVTISNSISPIMTSVDQFILSAVSGATAVASYALPFNVVNRVLIFPAAFSRALFPQLSKSNESEAAATAKHAATRTAFLMSLICAPGILAVGPLFHVWIPQLASTSTPIATVLFVGIWFNGIATVPFSLLQSQQRPDLIAKMHLIEVAPFLLLVWVMIAVWGAIGAAIAWSLRTAIDALLLNMISRWQAFPTAPSLASGLTLVLALSLSYIFSDRLLLLFCLSFMMGIVNVGILLLVSPSLVSSISEKLRR
jgi:O-antigen/teichoic acid export membrane protein